MLCNGPLSGRQEAVPENMVEYTFFEQPNISTVPTKAIVAKRRSYCKSPYKFGPHEIFIWEEDVPVMLI